MERRRADPFSQPSNMDTDHLSSYLSLTSDNHHFDQTQLSHYESALSSLVSSPTTTQPSNDSLVLRELIGRLGTICYNNNNNASVEDVINSANNSSYSTPLNSPPKVVPLRLPSFNGQLSRVSSCQSLMNVGMSMTGGAHLEENGVNNNNNLNNNNSSGGSNSNGRKRKASVKGKGKETHLASCSNHNSKISEEVSGVKRCKPDCEGGVEMKNVNSDNNSNGENNNELKNETENTPEPVKDYIHVRARRGQATDSHSLAERVRREKISERMKLLQDLVPGCNKVTGKAVMLDEIINYVQSLQRQVEFLSMKLATVNTQLDFTMDNIISKDVPHESYPSSSFANPNQAQMGPLNSVLTNNGIPNIPLDAFMNVDPNSQIGAIWDDLQSVVQMGFLQGQEGVLSSQSYHGSMPSSSQTKL